MYKKRYETGHSVWNLSFLALIPFFLLPGAFGQQANIASPAHLDTADAHRRAQPLESPDADLLALTMSQPKASRPDRNRKIYYRNKLEFSLESGWLPINIPFVFDFVTSSAYTTWPLRYTLVPSIASLRWQLNGLAGPPVLRGNWELSASAAYTAIPRGPETRYSAFDLGFRRNFVPRQWRAAPYFDFRLGVGDIDAKGPEGVRYAQGQDLSFTILMGSGVRYNFSPRFSASAGLTYMHVSNLYLSEPRVPDFGINVYGPIVGICWRVSKPKPALVQ